MALSVGPHPNSALSAGQLAIIAVVAVLSLAAWLILVFVADRQPRHRAAAGTTSLPHGYQVIERTVSGASPAAGTRLGSIAWPPGTTPGRGAARPHPQRRPPPPSACNPATRSACSPRPRPCQTTTGPRPLRKPRNPMTPGSASLAGKRQAG